MEDEDDAARLIEEAFAGVAIVVCVNCKGHGRIAKALDLICPVCKGSGRTTGEVVRNGD